MNEPNLNNKNNNKKNIIIKVEQNSIAEEMGVTAGDILVSINDSFIKDVLDYRYLIQDEYIDLLIQKPDGEEWLLEIDKDEYEDLGIVFESGLMDKAKSCTNKCIFCFIDQNPRGMRKTVYFKDDDSRLSFLQGNYITLTNMSDEDLDRIIFYHLSPINISVHATDMEVRKFMLKNPKSMKLMEQIGKLADAGIKMNFQIVLCKNINDGDVLSKSIKDLSKYVKLGCSMAVVPIGLTKHREKLYPLEHLTPEDLSNTINQVTECQEILFKEYGTRFVFLSDEFYLQSNRDFPEAECYEDYPQLDNGVGMIPLLKQDCFEYLNSISQEDLLKKNIIKNISIITGTLAYPVIKEICDKITNKFSNINITVYAIINNFYGESITVSGLLTGGDIIDQLKDKSLGDILYIPKNCIRTNDTVFLDDLDIKDVEKELNIKICLSSESGDAFVKQFLE